MFRKIFLAVSLVVSAAPSHAGGSMAPEVRVIVVNPSREISRIDEARRLEKSRREAEKAEAKKRLEAGRQLAKDMERRDRDYKKKMDRRAKDAKRK